MRAAAALAALALILAGCSSVPHAPTAALRTGDEIIVAGRRFHTGTRVVTWLEPEGYNAYRGKPGYGSRVAALEPKANREVKQHGWNVPALQGIIDQFVLHYDACGLSKVCFNVLQQRGLSIHFLLDVDGTVYQTMDLQEKAEHATIANARSIGIEIANIGAYAPADARRLEDWYQRDAAGRVRLAVPGRIRDPAIRTPDFTGRPDRPTPVRGKIQNNELVQYDYTPEQYDALVRLTAALCRVFPRLKCDYPHDAAGRLITRKLPDDVLARYHGVLGHYHIQDNKNDPGPALQWRRLIEAARQEMRR